MVEFTKSLPFLDKPGDMQTVPIEVANSIVAFRACMVDLRVEIDASRPQGVALQINNLINRTDSWTKLAEKWSSDESGLCGPVQHWVVAMIEGAAASADAVLVILKTQCEMSLLKDDILVRAQIDELAEVNGGHPAAQGKQWFHDLADHADATMDQLSNHAEETLLKSKGSLIDRSTTKTELVILASKRL
jgi:hypothetical protein